MSNILIVEDEHISAQYLKKVLTQNDFNVCSIEDNAKDALRAIKKFKPELVLIDVMLYGNQSGCELALDIRRFDNEIIIIFLSAHSDANILEYALNVNAYCYLLKPYRDSEIVTTIKMAFQQYRSEIHVNSILLRRGYSFDTKERKLYRDKTDTLLHGKLLDFVELLAKNRGSCIEYNKISLEIYANKSNINTIRSLVHRIKQKLPDLEIRSISKKGYVLYQFLKFFHNYITILLFEIHLI